MALDLILWDPDDDPIGNVRHCAAHSVTKDEVAEVLDDPIDIDVSRSSRQKIAFGETSAGRHLAVVFEEIDSETVYPITAYDAPRRRHR